MKNEVIFINCNKRDDRIPALKRKVRNFAKKAGYRVPDTYLRAIEIGLKLLEKNPRLFIRDIEEKE